MINAYNHIDENVDENLRRVSEIGGQKSATIYPTGWAMAGNTPFRRYKQFVDGGGVNTPLIVHWPAGIKNCGGIRSQFVHAVDITPTIVDLTKIEPLRECLGVPQKPLDGASMAQTFRDPSTPVRDRQYFEMLGRRGIWHRGWKALTHHQAGSDYSGDRWFLYRLDQDIAECNDLAAAEPEKLKALIEIWWDEAAKYGVLPLDDRQLSQLLFALPKTLAKRSNYTYHPSQSYVPTSAAPRLADRSFSILADLDRKHHRDEGVIVALGTELSGDAFYVKDRHLFFEYNSAGRRTVFGSKAELPLGPIEVEFRCCRTGTCTGEGALMIDGAIAATGVIPRLLHQPSLVGLQIGLNRFSPVSPDYAHRGHFAFTANALKRVRFHLSEGDYSREFAHAAECQQ